MYLVIIYPYFFINLPWKIYSISWKFHLGHLITSWVPVHHSNYPSVFFLFLPSFLSAILFCNFKSKRFKGMERLDNLLKMCSTVLLYHLWGLFSVYNSKLTLCPYVFPCSPHTTRNILFQSYQSQDHHILKLECIWTHICSDSYLNRNLHYNLLSDHPSSAQRLPRRNYCLPK